MLLRMWTHHRRLSGYLTRQYDRTDCGPAALHSILRYWGGDAPFSVVRDAAGTDLGGTSFIGLVRAARAIGLDARGVVGSYSALMEEDAPCIAHLILADGTHHYVVCESAGSDEIRVGDPMEGRRRMSREAFEDLWRSRALLLLTPTSHLRSDPAQSWLRWFSTYLLREPVWFIQSLFLGGIGALFGIVTAHFIKNLIDRFIPEGNVGTITYLGFALLGILLLRAATEHLRQRMVIRLNREVNLKLNRDFLSHILRLPLRFFETRATGDITARLSDGMRIQKAFLEGAGTALIDGTILVGSVTYLLLTAPPLGVLAAATLPAYGLVLASASKALQRDHGQSMAAFARVEGSYIDSLGSIEAISGYGVAASFVETNAARFGFFQGRVEALGIRHARLSFIVDLFGGILAVLALVWGSVLVVEGELLLGGLIAGYTLLVGILPSVGRMIHAFVSLQEASIAASRLRDLLHTPTERWHEGKPMSTIRKVELVRATVEWSDGSRPFDEASLVLRRGEMVGLVGPNGSGKSTLTRILSRSIDLSGGSLLVNEVPAEAASLVEYRARVLLLPNEVQVVSGTLAENVLFGRTVSGIGELEALVERLGLGSFMRRFRDRWATRIGEGGRRISSGERQVVGLMRALLIEPDLLLVDEGIGSTDEGNTALVLDAIRKFSREGIVLIISHDSRVVSSVDRLYRFCDGRIVPADSESGDSRSPTLSIHLPTQAFPHRRPYVLP